MTEALTRPAPIHTVSLTANCMGTIIAEALSAKSAFWDEKLDLCLDKDKEKTEKKL